MEMSAFGMWQSFSCDIYEAPAQQECSVWLVISLLWRISYIVCEFSPMAQFDVLSHKKLFYPVWMTNFKIIMAVAEQRCMYSSGQNNRNTFNIVQSSTTTTLHYRLSDYTNILETNKNSCDNLRFCKANIYCRAMY